MNAAYPAEQSRDFAVTHLSRKDFHAQNNTKAERQNVWPEVKGYFYRSCNWICGRCSGHYPSPATARWRCPIAKRKHDYLPLPIPSLVTKWGSDGYCLTRWSRLAGNLSSKGRYGSYRQQNTESDLVTEARHLSRLSRHLPDVHCMPGRRR